MSTLKKKKYFFWCNQLPQDCQNVYTIYTCFKCNLLKSLFFLFLFMPLRDFLDQFSAETHYLKVMPFCKIRLAMQNFCLLI